MILCSLAVATSMPSAHAANLVHTFYYGSTAQSGCLIKCEQLATVTGTADTTTSVHLGNSVTCCFEVQPDVSSSGTTATPSTATPTGQAWVYSIDLGGITIQSGTWRFDTTITASKAATASMRFLVWSCLTASEGTCTNLFDFTGTQNIEGVLSTPTTYTDTSGTIGPFSNIHYLTVEVWISPTIGGPPSTTDTMTSRLAVKNKLFRTLTGSISVSASLMEKNSLLRMLSGSLTLASSVIDHSSLFRGFTGSVTQNAAFVERTSLLRSFSGSFSVAGSQTKALAKLLTGSMGISSGLARMS